jgi:acyl carrier protein phosphodiesterase
LFRYWNLCKGDFYPQYPIGRYITLAAEEKRLLKEMRNPRNKVLTINDSVYAGDLEKKVEALDSEFRRLYPHRSSYELS